MWTCLLEEGEWCNRHKVGQTIQLNEYRYKQLMFLTILCDCFVFVSCIALTSPYTLTSLSV